MNRKKGKLRPQELRVTSFITRPIVELTLREQKELLAGSVICGTTVCGTVETCGNGPASSEC